jgi:hypothetical protein
VSGLPDPYDSVGATTLWRAEEIRELAKQRGEKRKMDAILQLEASKRAAKSAA